MAVVACRPKVLAPGTSFQCPPGLDDGPWRPRSPRLPPRVLLLATSLCPVCSIQLFGCSYSQWSLCADFVATGEVIPHRPHSLGMARWVDWSMFLLPGGHCPGGLPILLHTHLDDCQVRTASAIAPPPHSRAHTQERSLSKRARLCARARA